MENYKIIVKKSAKKELAVLPKKIIQELTKTIEALSHNPHPLGSHKLSGSEKYRLRKGDYRIIYSIDDGKLIILIITVGHRKDVYRNL